MSRPSPAPSRHCKSAVVEARPGRGTLVATKEAEDGAFKSAPSDEAGLIDLSVNRPATSAYREALSLLLPHIAKDRRFAPYRTIIP
jgi:hypothetical protein